MLQQNATKCAEIGQFFVQQMEQRAKVTVFTIDIFSDFGTEIGIATKHEERFFNIIIGCRSSVCWISLFSTR